MIEKELFCETLQVLQQQMAYDKKTSEILAEAFLCEVTLYDNSLLIKQIINLLGMWFDVEEINHYVFDLNFGKPSSDSECETYEQFYKRLTQ